MSWRLFLFLLFAIFVLWRYGGDWSARTPGIVAPAPPTQVMLAKGEVAPWPDGRFTITPLARYTIKARVLHREPYWFDYCANVSPLDLALGWQHMSDPAIYDKLNVSQSGRWYEYHWWGDPPLDQDEITAESANTHIIPADATIRSRVEGFSAGDIIQLKGYLVRVEGPNGFAWQSSLSRTDTGNGACEIMWVQKATRLGR
jgi:hypothetical protein